MRASAFTLCEFCGCNCGLYLRRMNGGRQVAVPSQVAGPGGGRLCLRGWQMGELYRGNRAVHTPRITCNGEQNQVSITEAIDEAATALRNYTPGDTESLGLLCSGRLTNEQALVVAEFADSVLGTTNIDNLGRALDGAAIWGTENALVEHYRRPSTRSLQNSDAIVALNSSLPYVSPQAAAWVVRARRNGAKVILLDEIAGDFAHHCDVVLTPEPGTLHAAIAQLSESIALADVLQGVGAGAAEVTGLPSDRVDRVCEILKNAQRPAVVFSASEIRRPQTAYLAATLARAAAGASPQASNALCIVGSAPNGRGVTLMGVWPIGDDGHRPGLSAEQMLRGDVRALLAIDAPIETYAGMNGLERLRDDLEFLCAVAAHESETTRVADVVVPMDTWHTDGGTVTGGGEGVWLVGDGADAAPQYPLVNTLDRIAQGMGENLPDVQIDSIRDRISTDTFAGYGEVEWNDLQSGEPLPLGAGYSPVVGADRAELSADVAKPLEPLGASDKYPLTMLVRRDRACMAFNPRVRAAPVLEREWANAREPYVTISVDTAKEAEMRPRRPVPIQTQFGDAEPMLRVSEHLPDDVIVVPWHCRDLVFTLCGPGNIDEATGVLDHPPVAAAIDSDESEQQ